MKLGTAKMVRLCSLLEFRNHVADYSLYMLFGIQV